MGHSKVEDEDGVSLTVAEIVADYSTLTSADRPSAKVPWYLTVSSALQCPAVASELGACISVPATATAPSPHAMPVGAPNGLQSNTTGTFLGTGTGTGSINSSIHLYF